MSLISTLGIWARLARTLGIYWASSQNMRLKIKFLTSLFAEKWTHKTEKIIESDLNNNLLLIFT